MNAELRQNTIARIEAHGFIVTDTGGKKHPHAVEHPSTLTPFYTVKRALNDEGLYDFAETLDGLAYVGRLTENEKDTTKKIHIGNVVIVPGGWENPYTYGKAGGKYVIGDDRVEALKAFRDGTGIPGYVLWEAPTNGGARRITSEDVDWSGMRTGT